LLFERENPKAYFLHVNKSYTKSGWGLVAVEAGYL